METETQPKEATGSPAPNPTESSPAAAPQSTPSSVGNQTPQPTVAPAQPDWRQSPEFRGIAKENRRYKEQLAEMQRKHAELEGRMSGFQQGQPRQQYDPQLLQGAESLVELMLQHPRTRQMLADGLGVSKISELEKGYQELSDSWYTSQANAERSSILDDAKKLGLDPEEVNSRLDELLEEHPIYSQANYKPGALKAVFRDAFFDRAGEFRERLVNKETIEKRDALKRGQVQQTGQPAGAKPKDADEAFRETIRQAGGLQNIDFTR